MPPCKGEGLSNFDGYSRIQFLELIYRFLKVGWRYGDELPAFCVL